MIPTPWLVLSDQRGREITLSCRHPKILHFWRPSGLLAKPRSLIFCSSIKGRVENVTFTAQIAFLDVTYASGVAGVACLLADTWTTATPALQITRCLQCIAAEYVPGEFYKRELDR